MNDTRLWLLIALLTVGLLAGYQWVSAPEPDEPLTFTRVKPAPPQDMQAPEQPVWTNAAPDVYQSKLDGITIRHNLIYGNTIVSNGMTVFEVPR